MSKYSITTGILDSPVKTVLYGPEGIGKSTFASHFPDPVFIDTEGGTKRLNIARLPQPTSWAMLLDEVNEVRKGAIPCGTLVIDTADWAERLAITALCAKAKVDGLEGFGYGKGYTYLKEEYGRLLDALEEVLNTGHNVLILAHSTISKFEQPDAVGNYDRWTMKTTKQVEPMLREWCDLLLFANYKTIVEKVGDSKNAKSKASGGRRVMYTTHTPCWDAKNRFGLPGEMPFDYAGIAHIIGDEKNIRSITEPNEPLAVNSADETPDKCKDVSDASAQAAVSEPAKTDGTVPDIPAGIPQALRDLMQANNVTATDIQTAVSAKGYFPLGMEITDYPADFVNGCLIGAWDQLYQVILKERKDIPF